MKQFFGAFFGSLVGIIIATLLAILLAVVIVKSSISSMKDDKEEISSIKPNSIIKLTLDGVINEREKENPLKELGDNFPIDMSEGMGLNAIIQRIEEAGDDDNVKGIYLSIKKVQAGFATVSDIRDALGKFRSKGKFIYAYSEDYSHKEYFVASVANRVFINPQGNIDWSGLNMSLMFLKHTFEKLDIDVQVFRHGKFKSAVEPFLLDKMSDANRYQSETFLNSIWNSMLTRIATDRKLHVDTLNAMANSLRLRYPSDAVGNLVDAEAYEDEVISELKKKVGIKEKEKLKFVDFEKYHHKGKVNLNASRVAVIYANGAISGGEGNDEEIGSDRLARTIREARLDDKIKAIVLRVNSPGGSALASDVIWREMVLAKKSKPVVVSMGDVAASGGYYISCGAERIFAQPNTITGSIGVFGIIPSFQRMLEKKLGITVDTVNTNKYSDMANGLRLVTEKEYAFIQNSVEKVYDTFTKRVAEGRKMSQAEVDSIGQGRVWSGSDALRIKLIDELGGLNDAVAYAVKRAGLKDFKVVEMPRQKGPFDGLFGQKEGEVETRIMKRNLGPTYVYLKQVREALTLKGVQARLPFEMLFAD